MKKLLTGLLLLASFVNLFAQSEKSNTTKRYLYRDQVVAIEKWYGDNKKIDSLKTYYKSGKLDECFYFHNGRYQGKSFKYNPSGEKITTWEFDNGELISRTDHIIEFNKKTEEKVLKAHARLKELNLEIKEEPKSLKLRFQRASIRKYLDNNTLALNDFKTAEKHILKISKTKKVPEKILGSLYDNLANIYADYEMHDYCIQYKLKAIKASPKESRLYHNLGSYLITIKSYRLGIVYLNKAIEMVPNHAFANWALSAAYTDLGEYDKAMVCVNTAFKNKANLYKRGEKNAERDLRTIRGLLYHKLGDSDKGIADLEEALIINNNNSFAYRNLGEVYFDLSNYNKACELLTKAKTLGYEKTFDRDDLQDYLNYSCEHVVDENQIVETTTETITETITETFTTPKLAEKPYAYPNPTKGEVNIKNLLFEDYVFLVFDYAGKQVKQGKKNTGINLSELPSGVYIIKIIHKDKSETFRVIRE
ncbi:T9SS type A sorting domain-containing protein [Tamlana sp. I1]|uniref:T9SS type A sorting domain-containing protein n=1 Tax=Tamlana sp. I1 TaxID=2762061 RepID=UPI0018901A20|nr:T9SS type A sorting domain-containing protein [Tamlana sp. I1]